MFQNDKQLKTLVVNLEKQYKYNKMQLFTLL